MVQIGIIGAGRIGQVHMRGIASGVPNAVIRSLADPMISPEAEQLARSIGVRFSGNVPANATTKLHFRIRYATGR